jgi:hypothetical protein
MRCSWNLSAVHKLWFVAIFLFGFVYVLLLPPFEINDEDSHWVRLWSVATGHVFCSSIPQAASDLTKPLHYKGPNGAERTARFAYVGEALDAPGNGAPDFEGSTACAYFPAGYLVAAVAARLVGLNGSGQPRRGGMMLAFLAARCANWLFLSGVVLLALCKLPWARGVILFFYSIPEVIQQSMAINIDSYLFGMTLILMIVVLRRARWRSIGWVALVSALMAVMKPIYAPLAFLALPIFVQISPDRPLNAKRVMILASLAVPLVSFSIWKATLPAAGLVAGLPWWNVDPGKQIAFLKDHPFHLLAVFWVQLRQTFDHNLMRGSWTSILGGFGWSAFEMQMAGYYSLLAGLLAAVMADLSNDVQPEPIGDRRGRPVVVGWIIPLLGIASIFPATILAMYL